MKRAETPTARSQSQKRVPLYVAGFLAVVCAAAFTLRHSAWSFGSSAHAPDAADQASGASADARAVPAQTTPSAHRVGDVLVYALGYESAIDATEGGRLYHASTTGKLTLRVLEVERERVLYAVSLSEAKLKAADARVDRSAESEGVTQELARPMFATFDAAGAVTDLRFDPKAQRATDDFFRTVLALMQVVGADKHAAAWSQVESDLTGSYLAKYAQAGGAGHLSKHKVAYTKLLAQTGGVADDAKVDVLSSEGDVQLAASGTLGQLRVREVVRTTIQALPELTSTTLLTLRLDSQGSAPDQVAALRDEAAKRKAVALYETPVTEGSEIAIDRAKVAGRGFEDFVREIKTLPAAKDENMDMRGRRRRLFVELAALFRLEESSVDAAVALIRQDGDVASFLWDALANAGTPKAQSALRGLIDDPYFTDSERRTQMIGLSFVPKATPETVEFLEGKVGDAMQGQQARFGLGTVANHLRGQDPKLVEQVIGVLAQGLRDSDQPNLQSDYLLALGNAAADDQKGLILEHLQSEDERVRASAAQALRYLNGDDVNETLTTLMREEASGYVRASAIGAAAERTPTPAMLDAVWDASRSEAYELARKQAVTTLQTWRANVPEVQAAIDEFEAQASVGPAVH